ncbi:TonB-dependent receptor plug domain-containing protein [Nitrosomonas marina]|nr:TonB-dependent receptor [Nitrosomonas marina]
MNIEVTTVSRQSQKLIDVASAIFVITSDDIRRSGATSIPDALRMAPGVQVARVGTDKWAVSVRGFNGLYANKLQVLMDGRSVYSPIFSGVLWEQQDTLMADIERIEVIRGPAATSWGANAVNGVINIITKKAADTQGTFLTAGGGSFEHGFIGARYGGEINAQTPFRIYAKGFTRDNTTALSGENIHNQWHSVRGGFRVDHARGNDEFTLQGDLFYLSKGDTLSRETIQLPSHIPTNGLRGHQEGGNIRFRWNRIFSEQNSILLQTYYDTNQTRLLPIGRTHDERFDIDFQHRFLLYGRHDLTWGANYRLYHNKISETELVKFTPAEQTNHLISAFIRDDLTLIPDRLLLSLGTRIEHNDFTGFEIQPNGRLMWTPNARNSIWMSVSRAVRTPSRAENDVTNTVGQLDSAGTFALPIPILLTLQGNSSFNSEKLIAYELGYRHQFSPQASIDIAGFINDYSQLRDLSFGALTFSTGLPQQFILPATVNNQASALTYGFETSIDWRPLSSWRLQSSYSFLDMDISSNKELKRLDPITGGADKISPQHQLSLRSNYDISEKLQLNLWLRYISKIAFYDIPDYVTMDAKLAFKPYKNIELFLVGQNLFAESHREFVADTIPSIPGVIPRGIYAGARWHF